MTSNVASPATAAWAAPDAPCQIYVSRDAEHRDWDAFLERTPGGHHTQTSAWAQAKRAMGWSAVRVIAVCAGRIVGGAQMLLVRPSRAIGDVGYVPKGPICAGQDASLPDRVLCELHALARSSQLRCLVVQPPNNAHAFARRLPGWGFSPGGMHLTQPSATAVLDLAKDPDKLLARMHPQTRYNIRLSARRGVSVREGTAEDLPIYGRLMRDTGQRQGFRPESEAYVAELYRRLALRGWLKLFIAEYQGEPLSAAVAICFGDTVYYKRGAWSGRHGAHRPNEGMQWHIIQWARSHGYRYYDFEGIDPSIARALLRGGSDLKRETVTSFKLGFGGEAVLFPDAYAYIYNPVLRWAWRRVVPAVSALPLARRVLLQLSRKGAPR